MVKPESGSSINKRTVSADGQRLLRGLVRCTVHWKRPWCWEGLGAGREGDDRGWDSWMASLTQWTWVWVNSGSWWWRGRLGVLQSMELQRVRHDWATELNWTELCSAWPRVVDAQWLCIEQNWRNMGNLSQILAKTWRWRMSQQPKWRCTRRCGVTCWQQLPLPQHLLGPQKSSAIRDVHLAMVPKHPSVKVHAPFRSSHNVLTNLCIYVRLSVREQRGHLCIALEGISVSF